MWPYENHPLLNLSDGTYPNQVSLGQYLTLHIDVCGLLMKALLNWNLPKVLLYIQILLFMTIFCLVTDTKGKSAT